MTEIPFNVINKIINYIPSSPCNRSLIRAIIYSDKEKCCVYSDKYTGYCIIHSILHLPIGKLHTTSPKSSITLFNELNLPKHSYHFNSAMDVNNIIALFTKIYVDFNKKYKHICCGGKGIIFKQRLFYPHKNCISLNDLKVN